MVADTANRLAYAPVLLYTNFTKSNNSEKLVELRESKLLLAITVTRRAINGTKVIKKILFQTVMAKFWLLLSLTFSFPLVFSRVIAATTPYNDDPDHLLSSFFFLTKLFIFLSKSISPLSFYWFQILLSAIKHEYWNSIWQNVIRRWISFLKLIFIEQKNIFAI